MLEFRKYNCTEDMFKPVDLRILVAAFDEAWKQLEKSGVRFDSDYQRRQVRNALGKCIIEEAKKGGRTR